MYQIALCEDDPIFAESLASNCESILEKLNLPYYLSVFENSSDFLDAICKEEKRYDLLLLDILMEGKNGIELARIMREKGSRATIIFVTATPNYAIQGYDVGALHYLMKPVDCSLLERLITADYQNRFRGAFCILKVGTEKVRVPLSEMVVLETVGRRVRVTLKEKTVCHSGKLSELLADFPQDLFVRCHQAFAVNVSSIRELSRQKMILTNGNEIPVSRSYAKDVQKAFLKQLRGAE